MEPAAELPAIPEADRVRSRLDVLVWRGKVAAHGAARLARWVVNAPEFPAPELAPSTGFDHLWYRAERRIGRADAGADPRLEAGKQINLRLAAPAFHGVLVAPDRPLSFWRTLGRISEAGGYRHGMELRGGCVVPSLGGGLCLLSNALFEMAARLGWRILERHGHTMEAAPAVGGVWGLDATVMWPYVDLRVAPRVGRARLEVEVRGAELCLAVHGERPATESSELVEVEGATEHSGPDVFRNNRILRRVSDRSTGALIEESVIAVNRKRLLSAAEVGRSCLTCERRDCHMRVVEVR